MNTADDALETQRKTAARIRIVLVGTQHPGNIGAAARALKTMGLSRLVLVAPEQYPADEAFRRAAGADDLLASASVVETRAGAALAPPLLRRAGSRLSSIQASPTATSIRPSARTGRPSATSCEMRPLVSPTRAAKAVLVSWLSSLVISAPRRWRGHALRSPAYGLAREEPTLSRSLPIDAPQTGPSGAADDARMTQE